MIRREDWLKAVDEAGIKRHEVTDDAITLVEFAALIGVKRPQASNRMRELIALGKAREVRRMQLRASGGYYPVPAYVLVESNDGENDARRGRQRLSRRRGRDRSRSGTR